jgi:uncharacterized membrane protein
MRGYKNISWFAAFIYVVCLFVVNFNSFEKANIENNKYLRHQLQQVGEMAGNKSVVIYGSSGVLLGLSARMFNQKTSYQSLNLSTYAQGGQFNKFFELVPRTKNKGKVLLLGDRRYRSQSPLNEVQPQIVTILKTFSLIVNIRHILNSRIQRDEYGDIVSYPSMYFENPKTTTIPKYSEFNLNLMKAQVDVALKVGLCPILVYVPLLVSDNSVPAHLAATEDLNALVREAGIEQYVAFTPMVETDKNLFIDIQHMSERGREKWTRLLIDEITSRQMCGLTAMKAYP